MLFFFILRTSSRRASLHERPSIRYLFLPPVIFLNAFTVLVRSTHVICFFNSGDRRGAAADFLSVWQSQQDCHVRQRLRLPGSRADGGRVHGYECARSGGHAGTAALMIDRQACGPTASYPHGRGNGTSVDNYRGCVNWNENDASK